MQQELRRGPRTTRRSLHWRSLQLTVAIGLGLAFAGGGSLHAGKREAHGVSVDLPRSFSAVRDVVQRVSGDGTIRGTLEYAHEPAISGAISARSAKLFPAWTGPGQVFYKIKNGAVAPAHFPGSNDSGTITVRYVVQALGPSATQLRIDALFVDVSRHGSHVSDGSVESSEFQEIDDQLSVLDKLAKRTEERAQHEQMEFQVKDLQRTLGDEKSQLALATSSVQKLEQRLGALRHESLATVNTDKAQAKVAPFLHAAIAAVLAKGQMVTVLERARYWYQIRGPNGKAEWVYYLLVDPVQ